MRIQDISHVKFPQLKCGVFETHITTEGRMHTMAADELSDRVDYIKRIIVRDVMYYTDEQLQRANDALKDLRLISEEIRVLTEETRNGFLNDPKLEEFHGTPNV